MKNVVLIFQNAFDICKWPISNKLSPLILDSNNILTIMHLDNLLTYNSYTYLSHLNSILINFMYVQFLKW